MGRNENLADDHPLKLRVRWGERVITALLFLAASLAVVISLVIIYTLVEGSVRFFSHPSVNIVDFLFGDEWVPKRSDPKFGILPLVAGTLLITVGAVAIGAPLGVGAALYLSEFASKRARSILKPIVEVLAGIPSIVYGFFALLVISPIFREHFGAGYFNGISAMIVMAVMVLPIVVSISDDALKAVPRHLREASYAMGATRWETSTKVVIPAASSGIIASILLGTARAIGETMVVMLAAGSVANLTANPFDEMQTMTAYIAQVATGDIPPGVAMDAAFAVGLVLFIMTYAINVVAGAVVDRIKSGKGSRRGGRGDRFRRSFVRALGRIGGSGRGSDGSSGGGSGGGRGRGKGADSPTGKGAGRPGDDGNGLPWVDSNLRWRYTKQRVGIGLTGMCLLIAGGFLAYLIYSVLIQGLFAIDMQFLTYFPSYHPEKAGIYPVIVGSLMLMGLTMLFAVPTGVGAAVYLNEIAPDKRSTRLLRRMIQNLAGVPSIVFGLVGLTVFVRFFELRPSLLAGSLILAIMVLPIITVSTEEALKSVPQSFREASLGTGATRWQTVRHHVLPNALPGILTGSILALSRAIGETAPILFIGAVFAKSPPSGVMDGFLALPLTIFYWTRHPNEEFHELAAATILVLMLILVSMNILAIIIRQRAQARRDW